MKNIGLFEQKEQIEIIRQQKEDIDFAREIRNLPYVFEDKVSFERKIDPKLLRFGSTIDGKEKDNERYYTINKILSPAELLLDTGAKIHLIGIKPNGKKSNESIQFLENLTRGQKVFLKFDEVKHDENNNLLCYLYLKNKTFVNAHLVKSGLVDVDTTSEYKMKSKFISLFAQSGRKNEGKD
jgi:site-specific DNA-methyltransferase (adenine-specific)